MLCAGNLRGLSTWVVFYGLLMFCLSGQSAFAGQDADTQVAKYEHFVDKQLDMFLQATERHSFTEVRVGLASNALFDALVVWDEAGQQLFPDLSPVAYVTDILTPKDYQRLLDQLNGSTPTSWYQSDFNARTLSYCRLRAGVSFCALIGTDALAQALDTTPNVLLPQLLAKVPLSPEASHWYLSNTFLALTLSMFLCLAVVCVGVYGFINKRKTKPKLRRQLSAEPTEVSQNDAAFFMAGLEVDARRMVIRYLDDTVAINPRDLKILTYLAQHPTEVVTKAELYDAGWGRDFVPNSRALEQHILTLRKKLDRLGASRSLIETVHGQGYRFSE